MYAVWWKNCVMCTKIGVPPKVSFIWPENKKTIYHRKDHLTIYLNNIYFGKVPTDNGALAAQTMHFLIKFILKCMFRR